MHTHKIQSGPAFAFDLSWPESARALVAAYIDCMLHTLNVYYTHIEYIYRHI